MAYDVTRGPLGTLYVGSEYVTTPRIAVGELRQSTLTAANFGLAEFPNILGIKFFATGGGTSENPCILSYDAFEHGVRTVLGSYNVLHQSQGYVQIARTNFTRAFTEVIIHVWNDPASTHAFSLVQFGTPAELIGI